jgi:hypothetical protein
MFLIAFFAFFVPAMGQAPRGKDVNLQNTQQMIDQHSARADEKWLELQLQKIQTAQQQANDYSPMRKGYFVSEPSSEYLLLAVSPAARESWLKKENATDLPQNAKKQLNAAFETLAAAIAEKLPTYRLNLESYSVRDKADEEIIKAALPDRENLKIYEIGLKQADWQTSLKDGEPVSRFKNAAVRAREKQADHPYCWLFYVELSQSLTDKNPSAVKSRVTTKQLVVCPR